MLYNSKTEISFSLSKNLDPRRSKTDPEPVNALYIALAKFEINISSTCRECDLTKHNSNINHFITTVHAYRDISVIVDGIVWSFFGEPVVNQPTDNFWFVIAAFGL